MQRFESRRPSQPVRAPTLFAASPPKSTRLRGIPRIALSLRVPDRALKASFGLPVSDGQFCVSRFLVGGRLASVVLAVMSGVCDGTTVAPLGRQRASGGGTVVEKRQQ